MGICQTRCRTKLGHFETVDEAIAAEAATFDLPAKQIDWLGLENVIRAIRASALRDEIQLERIDEALAAFTNR